MVVKKKPQNHPLHPAIVEQAKFEGELLKGLEQMAGSGELAKMIGQEHSKDLMKEVSAMSKKHKKNLKDFGIETAPLDHITTLIVGDWSDDGHGKTERITIKSNLTTKELQKAYKKGVKKCGVNLTEAVCEKYDDCMLNKPEINKLKKFGFVPADYEGDWFERSSKLTRNFCETLEN